MEEAIIALLLADSAVAALAGTRVHVGRAPQTLAGSPYVLLRRVTGIRDYTTRAPSGYVESRIQVDAYGKTYTSTKLTARAVIAALSGFRGTASGKQIQGIFVDGERDLPTADEDDDVNNLFRVSVDFMVHHSE
jgi:hypothetical protein